MKFWEAMKLLQEGKKIRNKDWKVSEYLYLKDGDICDDKHKICKISLNYFTICRYWEEYIEQTKGA